MTAPFRSGFVCIAGRPNVGKSTLLNRLVGEAVSITTPKPQTTRTRILGVMHGEGWQAVLMDTPGIHDARDLLNARMVGYATAALAEADLVLMMVEPFPPNRHEPGPQDRAVFGLVQRPERPAFLVINKIDRAEPSQVLETIAWYNERFHFAETVPVSALKGKSVDILQRLVPQYLPEGPPYFEPHQVTDQPERTLIAEMVRQAVFHRTEQEVPYSVAVGVDDLADRDGVLAIHATVYVERESQKGILIGKGGRMLTAVGREARLRMEALLGTRVYLELHVRVLPEWSTDPRRLAELGYPEE